jgi:hypothetical protein
MSNRVGRWLNAISDLESSREIRRHDTYSREMDAIDMLSLYL